MGTYTQQASNDYRNEGWVPTGLPTAWEVLSSGNDANYITSPAGALRAAVGFPTNLSTSSIPEGAVFSSVTVYIRFKKTVSDSTPVTVNVLSSLDPSKFTQSTLYPTTTITTVAVGTYPRDPSGNTWGMYELNYLLAQVSTTAGAGAVVVYELYSVLNFHTVPTLIVSAPQGTVKTPTPLVSWVYSQTDGDRQGSVDLSIYTDTAVNSVAFTPEVTTNALYTNSFTGDINSLTMPQSLTPGIYWVYLRVWSTIGAKSAWVGKSFTVQGPAPGTPVIESATLDHTASHVTLALRDTSNMMSTGAADAESGERIEFTPISCTLASSTAAFFGTGTASWSMTASGSNTMAANGPYCEVSPSTPITAVAQRRAAVTSRYTTLSVLFYDRSWTYINSVTSPVSDVSTTWTSQTVSGTTPDNAAFALVQLTVISPAAAEVHYFDAVGLMYGTNSVWSSGGHASRNLLDADYSSHPGYSSWTAAAGTTTSNHTSGFTALGANNPDALGLTGATIAPLIARVATGTVFTAASSGTAFTLNKPAGVTTGHLMLAYVACDNPVTCNPPAGWTQIAHLDSGSSDQADLTVLKRTAGASEPSTWTGSWGGPTARRQAVVVAYSGAADVSMQMLADNVSSNNSHATNKLTTGSVVNTDANAWRVSAFVFNDPVAGGTVTANTQGNTLISWVGAATPWTSDAANGNYTINKPQWVTTGDFMIAALSIDGNVSSSFTVPAGWTTMDYDYNSAASGENTVIVMGRTAGSSEPNSWSASFSTALRGRITQCVAYRGVEPISGSVLPLLSFGSNDRLNTGSAMVTKTLNNTDSRAWQVNLFLTTGTGSSDRSLSVTSRTDTGYYSSTYNRTSTVAFTDTNGPIGTGNHSYAASTANNTDIATTYTALLKPIVSPPSPPANETALAFDVAGSGYPWSMLGVFDSNGPTDVGPVTVTATQVPGSGSVYNSGTSWVGILRPATPAVTGVVSATMTSSVDISQVDPKVIVQADNKVTMNAMFLGTVSGSASLKLDFYRANRYLTTRVSDVFSFNTTIFTPCSATFDLPEGTTNIVGTVSAGGIPVGESVYVDTLGISFGANAVWRPGTSLSTHPVWSQPLIQYSEDRGLGYGDWTNLAGTTTIPPLYDYTSGSIDYIDQTLLPGTPRKYRVQTMTYGLLGDKFVSGYSTESAPVTLTPTQWWLKDLANVDDNLAVDVQSGNLTNDEATTAVVFQPLGRSRPIVVTDGYKGDGFELPMILHKSDFLALKKLLESGRTLYLQSDTDRAWWVRPTSGIKDETLVSSDRQADPIRIVTVSFAEVDQVE